MDDYVWIPGHGAIGPQDRPLRDWPFGAAGSNGEREAANDENDFVAVGGRLEWTGRDGFRTILDLDAGFIEITEPEQVAANDNRRGPYIGTHSGRFYPQDPHPEDFNISDVAHGLANICRYTGACRRRYSVAEHSVHISDWLKRNGYCAKVALAGLLHDAPEALSGFGDVARPAKELAPIISEIEDGIYRKAVAPKFGLPGTITAIVHEVDSRIIADEMTQNMHECDPRHNNPLGIELRYWSPAWAEAHFMMAFNTLMREREAEERRVA